MRTRADDVVEAGPRVSLFRNCAEHGIRTPWVLVLLCALLLGSPVAAQDAAALRARHAELRNQLAGNPFQRALYLESSENGRELKGDIYASVDHPYSDALVLQDLDRWCDILILHVNVKHCQRSRLQSPPTLVLAIARRFDQPLEDTYRVEFRFAVAVASADYLQVVLSSDTGPLDTRNYRIMLEGTSVDPSRTFFHMSYSYRSGAVARLAIGIYLATSARNKVGFTVVTRRADGTPVYIKGFRGAVERNAMRYYLAIESYLRAPGAEQLETRLRDWHSAVERYPIQLHELEREDYLDLKRREVLRQQRSAAG